MVSFKEGEMNWIKIQGLVILIALVSMINPLSLEALAEKKIGVLLWSEELRYIETKNGIMEQLGKEGFGEPAVKLTIENAGGSKAKLADITQKFAKAKMDLIISIGTTATIAVAREIKNVPIVFSMVYDPVEVNIARNWKSSGNNTTGTSSQVPVSKIMETLKSFAPAKRLAVLYTPAEKNSIVQLKKLLRVQSDYQIEVVPVPLTDSEEVALILPEVIRTVDAIYLSGSSIVGKTISMIVDLATKAKVVTITHLDDLVVECQDIVY
ncbi:MAG: ABC transporter substrate-binding protein [Desulfobacterales bacterium]|nr:ABC transporter substrate-binding protein [Desulfobacterales bacterium]